jgi:nitrite reductase/ring-hydroxylating ferredoxin subunit
MHKACPLSELAPGEALRLNTSPPIAVFHTEEGELFAIDDTCTHQDASLADGWVEDCARSTHPGSTYAREASTPRQPSCRSAPTK